MIYLPSPARDVRIRRKAASATAEEKHADALDAAERISLLSQRMRQVLEALAEGRLSKELAPPWD